MLLGFARPSALWFRRRRVVASELAKLGPKSVVVGPNPTEVNPMWPECDRIQANVDDGQI